VKALAIRELEKHQIPAIQKIVIYQKYAVDRRHLLSAFAALVMRDEPITIEEDRELGLETALRLACARDTARTPGFGGKRSGNLPCPLNIASVEVDALIRDIFQLSSPDMASSTPHAPSTRRRTPTGGRDSHQLGIQTGCPSSSSSNLPQGELSIGPLDACLLPRYIDVS
jgi:hypothetical protein